METARFWGAERVLVQGGGRWRLHGWPGWDELAGGDGEACPEPGGDRLVVRSPDGGLALSGGDARAELALPRELGPLATVAWGRGDGLLVVGGSRPHSPPYGAGPTLLPIPDAGPTAQPFGARPSEGMALWWLPLAGGPARRLAAVDGLSTIAGPVPLSDGGVAFEHVRWPLYGTPYSWRLLRGAMADGGGGDARDLFPELPGATAGLVPSPDGRRLAFLHSALEPAFPFWFSLALASPGREDALTYPLPAELRLTGRPPAWAPDGQTLAVTAFDGIRIGIVVVEPARGSWRWLGAADGAYREIALAPGGAEALASWQSPEVPARLCRVSDAGRAAIGAASAEPVARLRLVRWRVDGRPFEGVLGTPLTGDGPWPLVVDLHGGPINGLRFGRQPQLERWVSAGFAAFAPEHRESGIAGQSEMVAAFRCADDPPGLSAARDVLGGVDEVVRQGAADPERLLLFGHSAGANLAGRLIAADHRFRAAVCWEGVADWRLFFLLCGGHDYTRAMFGGSPWEAAERYAAASPAARAADVRTPVLLLYGDRAHHGSPPLLADGIAWYTTLRAHGVDADLVVYRGEGHLMSRSENEADLVSRSVAWFRAHMR